MAQVKTRSRHAIARFGWPEQGLRDAQIQRLQRALILHPAARGGRPLRVDLAAVILAGRQVEEVRLLEGVTSR